MRSVLAVHVAAPPDLVFDLVCDVERWAALLPHYVEVRRFRTPSSLPTGVPDTAVFARYLAVRPLVRPLGIGFPIVWRSLSWAPDRRHLRFLHVGGPTDGMEVTWTIQPGAPGCRVEIEHLLRRPPPLPEVIDRAVIRPVAGQTLATVRSIAEALARSNSAPGA